MLTDERARANLRDDQAFAPQAVVGNGHSRARDTERACQFSRRWKQVTRAQVTVEYRAPQLAVDFAAQILATQETDVNLHPVKYYAAKLD